MNIERFTFVPYEENHIHIVSFSFPVQHFPLESAGE